MSESLQDSQQGHSLAMYVVDSPMGRGAGSFVYKVKNRKTQQYAALKVIEKNKDKAEKIKQRIQNEIEVHSSLEHENLVTLYGHFEDKDNYYLLMEVCEGGELYSLVKKKGRLSEEEIRNYGLQFAKGLKYLHNNHVLHRDLKLSNLLLTDQNILKICDFGLAVKLLDLEEERETLCGTPNYISPEIVKNEPYGIKADTWSYGCILYAMATGNPPFEGNSVKETLTKVQVGGLAIPGDLSPNLQDLLRKLICMDPKARFNIEDVLNHPFFTMRTKTMPPVPPLAKLKSNPLDSLSTNQSTSGDNTPTLPEPESSRTRGRREMNKAFDFGVPNSNRAPLSCRQPKASSVACTPETRNRTKNCTGKPPMSLYYNQNVGTCPNSEEKENQRVDNLGESHASQFYKKRQELKKKHRASSKSIVGMPMSNNPHSQSWNNNRLRESGMRNLSLAHPTRSDPANGQDALRMSDLRPSFGFNGRSSTASSLGYGDTASSVGGEDSHGYKQYDDRKITPINTVGLKQYKFNIKGGVLEITESGWIILDLVNSKRKMSISPEGGQVVIEKTSPFRIEKSYSLNTVPSKYLKFYTYAGQVIETLKTRTQRVKIEEDEGTFTLLQKKPFPTFEARFKTGEKVSHTLSSETMRIQMINGQIFEINVLDDASYLGEQLNCLVKKTLEKMNVCIQRSDIQTN